LWIAGNIYGPAAFLAKLTLLLLIARVFSVRPGVGISIYVFVGALFIYTLAIGILKFIICLPLEENWENLPSRRCHGQRKLFVADSTVSVFSDLLILLIAIPSTWSIQVRLRTKLKVMSLMGVGVLAVGLATWRSYRAIVSLHGVDIGSQVAIIVITS
jgi:hypothetical protein